MKIQNLNQKDITFSAPPAKAHTLRSIILSALSDGISKITNPLLGEDQLHLIQCLRDLGVNIENNKDHLVVHGVNGIFNPVNTTLNCGESGVTMNVLVVICTLVDSNITLTGAPGLLLRPIEEVVSGIEQLGAKIEYLDKEGFPPVLIKKSKITENITKLSGSKTSQYFSALSMIAPLLENETTIICKDDMSEKPYFDITEAMMNKFEVEIINNKYKTIISSPNQHYKAQDLTIEGDYSSSSFFMLGASINGLSMIIKGLNKKSKQGDRKIIDYLCKMGIQISWNGDDLVITGNKTLTSVSLDMSDTPDLVPPMAIAAAFASGKSKFTGVGHLIYKECNRLEAVVNGLKQMGIECSYDEDNLYITGNRKALKGNRIDSYNDHRIAMSFAIAGLSVENQDIVDHKCVSKSFPNFWNEIQLFY